MASFVVTNTSLCLKSIDLIFIFIIFNAVINNNYVTVFFVFFFRYAQKIGLKTKSYGGKKEENRHLVVSKRIDMWTIIDGLVKNIDQFFNKYELLRPGENIADSRLVVDYDDI